MIHHSFRITISKQRQKDDKLNEQLQYLGRSLGLFTDRDKDNSCFRVFIELLQFKNHPISSDQIAYKTNLSRGTVIHHMHKLLEAGIVIQENNKYILRVSSLKKLVGEIKKDIDRLMLDMEQIATDIDNKLGIEEDDLYNMSH